MCNTTLVSFGRGSGVLAPSNAPNTLQDWEITKATRHAVVHSRTNTARAPASHQHTSSMAAQQQQPRGILKNKHEGGQRPHLTWDEETIAEHDKERGTRMKIDEPDTPYARYDPAEDPDVVQGASPLSPPKELQPVRSTSLDDHLGDLSEKLARAATDSEKPRAALFVEEEERDEEKARAFAAKRQQHYNMAGLLGRKWDEEDEMEDD